MVRALRIAALGFALALAPSLVSAQATNPLRPASNRAAAPAQAPAASAPAAETPAPKAKRQRSPGQLAADQRMRDCGAEWRANKAALTAQGKTWRTFNVECRARLKAQGR